MAKQWNPEELMRSVTGYQAACVVAAAAELELFDAMGEAAFTAHDAAARLKVARRALGVLLDALAALEVLEKDASSGRYRVPASVRDLLTARGPRSMLAMVQHHANCMRRWTELAAVVQSDRPAPRRASIRGESADYASFVEAMDNISRPMAPKVIGDLMPLPFTHVLDIGGASGTWTIHFLKLNPAATATIFDLPHVIPQAHQRMSDAGMLDRTKLVGGDYMTDPLPHGADLAWVSAIIHSLSRDESRQLYQRTYAALVPGGQVLIRDFFMTPSRTAPAAGALFAINMLTATEGGGTYTFDEVREDLEAAGFSDVRMLRPDDTMSAVVAARKAK